MLPVGTITSIQDTSGPSLIPRYNLYPAGFDYEWTELAFQEKSTSNKALIIFSLAVLFVFLFLSP
jgi:HAE1 family hydrophobic/amphiphilic exporter-1